MELPHRRRRRHHDRHVLPLALRHRATSSAPIKSLVAYGATDIHERLDEIPATYNATADDSAYAIFLLENGITCQFNSSWCTRVRRDDLLTIQVDGTNGSAVAGLREVWSQSTQQTPKPVWNPDIPQPINFYDTLAKSLRPTRIRQRLQNPMGTFPSPRRTERAV